MNPNSTSRLLLIVAMLIGVGTVASAANAATHWAIGERTDEQIAQLRAALQEFVDDAEEAGDEGAAVLYYTKHLYAHIDEHSIRTNKATYVIDDTAEEVETMVVRFDRDRKLELASGWILHPDGSIDRLTETDIRVSTEEGEGMSSVVFAFPGVEPGDILGASHQLSSTRSTGGLYVPISSRYPVKYARVTLESDGHVGYHITGNNLEPDSYEVKELEQKNLAASKVKITIRDTPRAARYDNAPPYMSTEPHIMITQRGVYIEFLSDWYYNRSWNQIAVTLDHSLPEAMKETKEIKQQVAAITAGLVDSRAKAAALFEFVRDEILLIYSDEVEDNSLDATQTLKDRAGTAWDQNVLLIAMMRSAGIPAEMGFARSRYLSKLDMRHCSLSQFTHTVVRVPSGADASSAWYEASCKDCKPEVLPASLWGVNAFFGKEGIAERWQKIAMDVRMRATDFILLNEWNRRLKKEDWHRFETTPGLFAGTGRWTRELVEVLPDGATVELSSSDVGELASLKRRYPDPVDCLQAYVEDRFDGATVDSVEATSLEDGSALRGSISLVSTPPANEETWVIPASSVYGTPTFGDWSPEWGPFHIDEASQSITIWRSPLPAGWDGVELPENLNEANERFTYRVTFEVDDGSLVVTRWVERRPGTTFGEGSKDLARGLEFVRGVEESSLVLMRSEATGAK